MDSSHTDIAATPHLAMSDSDWERARTQARVIAQLAEYDKVGVVAADAAAEELGVSRRQIYRLIQRHRAGSGLVTDLLSGQSHGGRGRNRLPDAVEDIVRETIRKRFLSRQKPSMSAVYREIVRLCARQGLPAPSRNTVIARIKRMDPAQTGRRREGPDGVRALQAAGGQPPPVEEILEQVQIDHTVIDVIVVDDRERQPIGRPYLTVAIDVFSRCILGTVVTLEPPSAVSVGLCLAHAVRDKRPWLEHLGLEISWPMSGKPKALYVDNAREFTSEALTRGCEQHGIELGYRPPGQPHYGGIIERVIGTAMSQIHDELPGTTFSNPVQRGSYDSEKKSALTMEELEKWLVLAVATYHGTAHRTLGQTPAGRWDEGAAKAGRPVTTTRPTAFLVDFLPVFRRSLTRTGFVVDHVGYFSNALKPWISRRKDLDRFIIRRDPRDISRIWVLEPDGDAYLEVPYRTLSNPAVSVWEHRQALARLRERGQAQVDELALFQMIEQMRWISETAEKTTKRLRREQQRRASATTATRPARQNTPLEIPNDADVVATPAQPFEEMEQW